MSIEAVCFTQRGRELGEKLADKLAGTLVAIRVTRCGGDGPSVHDWVAEHFATSDALLFIGAAGIAVRAIAPHVASKTSDPAVLVMDERGRHVIPLLSGHIGGANALATLLAGLLGAEAVITTATDLSGVFAVDTWAGENDYHIQSPEKIKMVSAKLLAGETIKLYSMFPVEGELPESIIHTQDAENSDVSVTVYGGTGYPETLRLTPTALVLGVGCRMGTSSDALEAAFSELCAKENLHPAAFGIVCSIDLKKDEQGLLAFCKKHNWPLRTFTAGELERAPGAYTASSFVAETTGVDNVCERSAMLGGDAGGKLLVKKTAGNGITLAVAAQNWTVRFEGKV